MGSSYTKPYWKNQFRSASPSTSEALKAHKNVANEPKTLDKNKVQNPKPQTNNILIKKKQQTLKPKQIR